MSNRLRPATYTLHLLGNISELVEWGRGGDFGVEAVGEDVEALLLVRQTHQDFLVEPPGVETYEL